jgi:hypothetical protein
MSSPTRDMSENNSQGENVENNTINPSHPQPPASEPSSPPRQLAANTVASPIAPQYEAPVPNMFQGGNVGNNTNYPFLPHVAPATAPAPVSLHPEADTIASPTPRATQYEAPIPEMFNTDSRAVMNSTQVTGEQQ